MLLLAYVLDTIVNTFIYLFNSVFLTSYLAVDSRDASLCLRDNICHHGWFIDIPSYVVHVAKTYECICIRDTVETV